MSCTFTPRILNSTQEQSDTLITCHSNADFDAFASIIAAQLIYPGAMLLFPGTQEKSLLNFYTETAQFMYNFKEISKINWDSITRLIIVDTRQYSRVPHVKQLLEREDLEIYIWDHHPPSQDDINTPYCNVDKLGATTTLLLREIQSNNLAISCQDATILGLGIYADTGSFTYASTTTHDYIAAAWLLEKGMDVNTIADLAAHELTSTHIQALNALLESATSYTVGNETVVIADISMEHYLGDFALLAHKLMEMERFKVLFALGRMGDCITVVGRSRNSAIDVGKVCVALGGGGHSYAASATVREKTMYQIRELILQNLSSQVQSDKFARDYMTPHPIGIEDDKSMQDAHTLLLQYGFKAIPIFKKGTRKCVGILDVLTASRGVNLNENQLDHYMSQEVQTLPPDASLGKVIHILVGLRQQLVPIVENDEVVGVISHSDLIQIYTDKSNDAPITLREGRKERSLITMMRERLPKDIFALLKTISELGHNTNMHTYAVGGFVRDLLLNQPTFDIDIVVEGDAIAFARELGKILKGRVREHQEFLTAVVIFKDSAKKVRNIDVATARLEYYKHAAAMPSVNQSSLKLDLIRRDFTINALAIRLDKDVFGRLVDFFGGQQDINDKRIRLLHSLSFIEDPSRCLRAIRFEQRYGFKLGEAHEKLIKKAINRHLMEQLHGSRLFHELSLNFVESNPVAILMRLDNIGLLPAIHPFLQLSQEKLTLLNSVKDILDWYRLLYFEQNPQQWLLYILALCHKLGHKECSEVIKRIGATSIQQKAFLQFRERVRSTRLRIKEWNKNKHKQVSDLCDILEHISIEVILFAMSRTVSEKLKKALSRYLTTWQHAKISINGQDLMDLGLQPGPEFKNILIATKNAKLNGLAPTRESQLDIAKQMVTEILSNRSK